MVEDDSIFDNLVSAAETLDALGRPESAVEILKNVALSRPSVDIFNDIIRKARLIHDAGSIEAAAAALRKIYRDAGDDEALQALERLAVLYPGTTMERKLPRVAGIMDEFTTASYSPECIYLPLKPATACEQITNFRPDFVFVESAWQGNDGTWTRMISTASDTLRRMLGWCRLHGIPTMFWNKEDPVHYHTFLDTASLFDMVFTTDIDCIPAYKQAFGHDNVYFLPFAAQPLAHNPLSVLERRDAFNFAGSYYLRYPQRQRDIATVLDTVGALRPVEIYDRHHGEDHPEYKFPDRYQPLILGKLPFSEIDKAYKGYRFGINMNTIKQSQSMFARRVYELMASNTIVVSNFSRGLRTMFGDLVICTDDGGQLTSALNALTGDDVRYRKLRLLGLRKVMQHHTYAERMAYILSKVRGSPIQPETANVALFATASDADAVARLVAASRAQSHRDHKLYLLAPGHAPETSGRQISVYDSMDALVADALRDKQSFAFFGLLHDRDHYGAQYLTDLVLSRRYAAADAVGKGCHFQLRDGEPRLCPKEQPYGFVRSLPMRAALVRSRHMTANAIREMLESPAAAVIANPELRLLAIDEFNYCRDGTGDSRSQAATADLDVIFQGIDPGTLYSIAESLRQAPRRMRPAAKAGLTATDMMQRLSCSPHIGFAIEGARLCIVSRLPEGQHADIWLNGFESRETLDLLEHNMVHFEMEGDTQGAFLMCRYYAADGGKLGHAMLKTGGSHTLAIPSACIRLEIGFQLRGPGTLRVGEITFGDDRAISPMILGASDTLVLTRQYPSYNDPGQRLLHDRIRACRQKGIGVDVFRLDAGIERNYDEFENIDVASGDEVLLDATLATGRYRHVCAHMLDENMWRVLSTYLDRLRVTIRVDGPEVQALRKHADEFARMNPEGLEEQEQPASSTSALWREVLQTRCANLRLDFASESGCLDPEYLDARP